MGSAVSDNVLRRNVQVHAITIDDCRVEYACAGVAGGPDDDSTPLYLIDVCVWYRMENGPWKPSVFAAIHEAKAALSLCRTTQDVRWIMECD